MRTSLAFALLATAAACGTSSDPMNPGDDDVVDPPPDRGFRIQSPDIDIQPGEEVTYCYYFRTPNTEKLAIDHWKSVMTPGSHHMIMFTTGNTDAQPVGTVTQSNCGIGANGNNVAIWTYAAQNVESELQLPADDGTGKPLAQEIAPNSGGYFQMHYLNATDAPIKAHVTLDAFALEAAATYTLTEPFITFNGSISIPPMSTGTVATQTCTTPANTKFWLMSTHAHKQAVKTQVKDGSAMVFESDDWEHPGAKEMDSPFYSFGTGKLTYECTYDNASNRTITTGESAATDEMCMATGYFFPATKPVFCYNSFIVPI